MDSEQLVRIQSVEVLEGFRVRLGFTDGTRLRPERLRAES